MNWTKDDYGKLHKRLDGLALEMAYLKILADEARKWKWVTRVFGLMGFGIGLLIRGWF